MSRWYGKKYGKLKEKTKGFSMNRIKDLREDRDLRQIDVAEAVGIDQRSLSNYETGKTNPDSDTIVKLASFFGVTCDYLLGVSDSILMDNKAVVKELEQIKEKLADIQRYLGK